MTAPTAAESRRRKGPRIVLRFALTTVAGLVIAGACIVFLVRGFFIRTQEAAVASHAQLVTQLVLATQLQPADFAHPSPARLVELDRMFRNEVLTGGLVEGTIYSPDGTVVYSTEPKSIGRRTADSAFVRKAALTTTIDSRTARHRIGGKRMKVLEEAVPIRFGPRDAAGVVVLSGDYGRVTSAAAREFIPVSIAIELLLAMVFVALVPSLRFGIRQTRKHLRDTESRALRDTLTGLPNRRLFDDRLLHTLAQAQREGTGVAVLLIDLDRFKEVNDTVGHDAGDALLQESARRLSSVLRECDTIARLGGDEFAVVLGDTTFDGACETAQRMLQTLETPVEHDGLMLNVGASIGIALHPEHGKTPAALMKLADVAMYKAKRGGLGSVVYDRDANTNDAERIALTGQLRDALARGEILLHYQPTIALGTGELAGVEALLRWNHPVRGLLSADEFMPLAEQAGVRAKLYEFGLVEAIRQAGEWRRDGMTLSVAVNLDERMLVDRDLPARVERLLGEHGVDAEQIEAEIAEASLLGDGDRVRSVAVQLAALGIILVVGDFGADYSSLDSLAYLPIEKLKIDRTFVARAQESRSQHVIVAGTITLAHELRLWVVAAGVENAEMLELVTELGTDYAQGYHIGRPIDAGAVRKLALRRAA